MPKPFKRSLFWILLISFLFMPVIPGQAQQEEELITMNFEDADIRILIKFISELVQKNFIIDDKIKGKVTIISPEKITVSEAYRVFESILEVKGFTLVPAGKVTKIVPKNEAKTRAIKTDTGKSLPRTERSDEFITRITRLEYVNVNDMITLIRPLFSKEGNVQPYQSTNTLIMTELKSNLYRILKIINELDVKGYHAELYVIPLEYASVKTVSDHLNKILEQGSVTGSTARRQPVRRGGTPAATAQASVAGVSASAKIISDNRTNSLIVLATKNDYETITKLVKRLDVEAPEGKGRVNIYYLQNAVADEMVAVLNEFISGIKADQQKGEQGAVRLPTQTDIKIVADKATNSLIINADPEDYEQIKAVISKLDIPRSQVLIEALFMEVRGTDSLSLGVEWEAFGGEVGTDDSIDRLGFGGSLTDGGILPSVIGSINDREIPTNLGNGFNLGVFGNFIEVDGLEFPSISALITAVATRADTNILATPQILTMDNEEAEIKVGENRPFLTQARTGEQGVNDVFQSFDFRDVGLTLKVTPHISQNRTVRLELFQEISRVNEEATTGPGGTGATAPVTTKRSADTTVVVKDGHTIVIGGLIEDDLTDTETKTPCLGDIPLIKHLFRSQRNSTGKTNLMIFLTPHIVTNSIEAAELSEEKFHTFEEFRDYEKKDPELDFFGQKLESERSKQMDRHAPYIPMEKPIQVHEPEANPEDSMDVEPVPAAPLQEKPSPDSSSAIEEEAAPVMIDDQTETEQQE
jgi:general secretion pathway protein D